MKKEKFNIRRIYRESWKYIYDTRDYLALIAISFLASAVIGFFFSDNFGFFNKIIKEIIEDTKDLSWIKMMWFIFVNNSISSIWGMLLGIFFGIIPIFTSLFNGALLGYVYSKASVIEGYGVIWRLVPHGIFELPAVFISLALGIKLGSVWMAKDKKKYFLENIRKCMIVFITIVLPLLIVAAIIEGTLIAFG